MKTTITVATALLVFAGVAWLGFGPHEETPPEPFFIVGGATMIVPADGGAPILNVDDGKRSFFVDVSSTTDLKGIEVSPQGVLWKLGDEHKYGVRGRLVKKADTTYLEANAVEYLGKGK